LTDYTLIHLAFHARAMEMYTYAHQQLLNIDIPHDLEVNLIDHCINLFEFLRNFVPLHHFIVFILLNEVLAKQPSIIHNEQQ
jgi:hypothetical protein